MSNFLGAPNPILEITDAVLAKYPYRKVSHPTFGMTWHSRGGQFVIPEDSRQFFLIEDAQQKGIRTKRFAAFAISAGMATSETGGWLTEEYRYYPESNGLTVVRSMAPLGETGIEFKARQHQLRRESFGPDATAELTERLQFIELVQLIGEKATLSDEQNT